MVFSYYMIDIEFQQIIFCSIFNFHFEIFNYYIIHSMLDINYSF